MLRVDLASTGDPGLWGDDPDGAYPTPGIVRAIIDYALDHGWDPAAIGGHHVLGTDAQLEIPGFRITNANIARTDRDIASIRQRADDLADLVADPLAPPIRHQREQRELHRLHQIIEHHQETAP